MKKKVYALTLSLLFFNLTGCMSMNTENLAPGQQVSDEIVYITGKVSINIPEKNIPPEKYRAAALILSKELENGEEVIEYLEIQQNEVFYKSLPRGRYEVKGISYFIQEKPIDALGIQLAAINVYATESELDLINSDFAYLGDMVLTYEENPYGNYDRVALINDQIDGIEVLTEGWLMDGQGQSVKPMDISASMETMELMEEPFPITTTGYKFKGKTKQYFVPEDEDFQGIPADARIAFLSVDDNYATWNIVNKMDSYAQSEYKADIYSQKELMNTLTPYPSVIYEDNFKTEGTFTGVSFTEDYNEDFDKTALELAEKMDLDYLYILYHIMGCTYDTRSPGRLGKNGIYMTVHGRLFDVKNSSFAGDSYVKKKENIPLLSFASADEKAEKAEEKLFGIIAEEIVDALYRD